MRGDDTSRERRTHQEKQDASMGHCHRVHQSRNTCVSVRDLRLNETLRLRTSFVRPSSDRDIRGPAPRCSGIHELRPILRSCSAPISSCLLDRPMPCRALADRPHPTQSIERTRPAPQDTPVH
jgi:hypothetical protein